MINFFRTPKPPELTEELQKELTDKFKTDGSSVWSDLDFLKTALLDMTHHKCAYSESKLQTEGKYMEVEHYLPKGQYKDLVLEWDNLLPANKKCNVTKSGHDTFAEPIINPCVHTPKKHLTLKNYRFYPKTALGKTTIDVTAINDREHFVDNRFEIGNKILEKLADLKDYFETFHAGTDVSAVRLRHKVSSLLAILYEAKPEYEYSSTVATVVLNDVNYTRIKEILRLNQKWTDELAGLDSYMSEIAFDEA